MMFDVTELLDLFFVNCTRIASIGFVIYYCPAHFSDEIK